MSTHDEQSIVQHAAGLACWCSARADEVEGILRRRVLGDDELRRMGEIQVETLRRMSQQQSFFAALSFDPHAPWWVWVPVRLRLWWRGQG